MFKDYNKDVTLRLDLVPHCKILTHSTDGAADTFNICNEAIINDMHEAGFSNISSMGNTRILQVYISSKKKTCL